MSRKGGRRYEPPAINDYGKVESITKNLDKIGSADDGVEYQGEGELDGDIQPD